MINLSSFPNFIKQTRKQVLDEAKVQAFKYRCYTKEDIDAFNAVNLICFCVFIAEDCLSYKVNRLVLRSHPHIIVYPEGFYDSSDQRYYHLALPVYNHTTLYTPDAPRITIEKRRKSVGAIHESPLDNREQIKDNR